jgi:Tfp pilus assembly protein PilO
VLLIVGYWFLLLSPKREEAAKAASELTEQKEARDDARTQLSTLKGTKTSFAADYAQLVRLGKAIPSSVDMPSLIVQLDKAARGTGIKFTKIATGEREAAAPAPAATQGGSGDKAKEGEEGSPPPAGSATTTPAAGGGAPAQSAPGQAGESAAAGVDAANGQNSENAKDPTAKDAQTSQPAKDGKLPVGGAAGGAGAAAPEAGGCAPGLECIPLEFEFDGRFFDLADFFHRLKRFVEVANDKVLVRGRLLTIDNLKFSSGESFPKLKAEVSATVYLAPKAQGQTAGATPQGPAATPPAGSTPAGGTPGATSPQPASSSQPPTAATTP